MLGSIPAGNAEDADKAVRAAREAFVSWSTTSVPRAERILTDDGKTVGVEAIYTDPQTQRNSRVVVHAPAVVAAASSLETPALLLRSGIGGPAVGTQLRLHPASLVTGIYDEPRIRGSAPRWPAS